MNKFKVGDIIKVVNVDGIGEKYLMGRIGIITRENYMYGDYELVEIKIDGEKLNGSSFYPYRFVKINCKYGAI